MNRILLMIIALMLFPSTVFSANYKWMDEKGSYHFTDNAQLVPEAKRADARFEFPELGPVAPLVIISYHKPKEPTIEEIISNIVDEVVKRRQMEMHVSTKNMIEAEFKKIAEKVEKPKIIIKRYIIKTRHHKKPRSNRKHHKH